MEGAEWEVQAKSRKHVKKGYEVEREAWAVDHVGGDEVDRRKSHMFLFSGQVMRLQLALFRTQSGTQRPNSTIVHDQRFVCLE